MLPLPYYFPPSPFLIDLHGIQYHSSLLPKMESKSFVLCSKLFVRCRCRLLLVLFVVVVVCWKCVQLLACLFRLLAQLTHRVMRCSAFSKESYWTSLLASRLDLLWLIWQSTTWSICVNGERHRDVGADRLACLGNEKTRTRLSTQQRHKRICTCVST